MGYYISWFILSIMFAFGIGVFCWMIHGLWGEIKFRLKRGFWRDSGECIGR